MSCCIAIARFVARAKSSRNPTSAPHAAIADAPSRHVIHQERWNMKRLLRLKLSLPRDLQEYRAVGPHARIVGKTIQRQVGFQRRIGFPGNRLRPEGSAT